MNRGLIWIALVVPAIALAAPRKKPKKKAKKPEPAETAKPEAAEDTTETTPDAPTGTPTQPLAGGTAQPGGGSGSGVGSGSAQPVGAKPGTPTTTPTGTGTTGAKPGSPLTTPTGTPGTKPTVPTGTPASTPTQPGQPTGDATEPEDKPAAKDVDVDTLRQEYLSLRDELFKSRARANAVASQLYSTRVTIKFTWGSARFYGVSKASIRLDGATVYEDTTGAIAGDDGVRFEGYVAPGRHLVTFHVEAAGKDDDSFTSATEAQIVVKAVANKDLVVSAKGKDSGDIAYAWKRGEKGSYGLGIDVAVKSVAQGAKK